MRSGIRFLGTLSAVLAVLLGLPALLAVAAVQRFDHVSPLHGVQAPWRWSIEEMRSWGRRLSQGLDSSAALVDIFFRVALVVGWICVVVLIYTLVDEVVFQLRHGMPSSRHRRLAGLGSLGSLGRRLATILIAVLPLVASASPTLAGPVAPRAAAGAVFQRPPDLPEPTTAVFTMPIPDEATSTSALGDGWSVVEVKRGDSVWGIAQRIADGGDVAAIAEQIVGANLGSVMSDGHRFSTPALIEPGWLLNVPSTGPAVPINLAPMNASMSESYVVVAGDSYWRIAENNLDPSATDGDIAAYTRELMNINARTLGYRDQRLIRPGDVVQLSLPTVAADAPAPAIDSSTLDVAPNVVASVPPVLVPLPTVVDLPPVVESSLPTTPLSTQVATPTSASVEPAIAAVVEHWSNNGVPVKRGLAAAVLLSGGAIAVLEARRRQQLRSAQAGRVCCLRPIKQLRPSC